MVKEVEEEDMVEEKLNEASKVEEEEVYEMYKVEG